MSARVSPRRARSKLLTQRIIRPVEAGNRPEPAEVERPGEPVDVFVLDVELSLEQLQDPL